MSSLLMNCTQRRTGIVYNVSLSSVGVIVHKVVGNRYIEKRVNLRVEHVRHSKCRQEFLDRVKRNHDAHAEAKEKGGEFGVCWSISCPESISERINLRRIPVLPREAHTVSAKENLPQTMVPIPYETTI